MHAFNPLRALAFDIQFTIIMHFNLFVLAFSNIFPWYVKEEILVESGQMLFGKSKSGAAENCMSHFLVVSHFHPLPAKK